MITAKEANELSEKLAAEESLKFQKERNEIRQQDLEEIERRIKDTYDGIKKRIDDIVITYGTSEYLKTLGYKVKCLDDIQNRGQILNHYKIEWGDDKQ